MLDVVPGTSLAATLGLRAARTPARTAYVFLAEGEEEQDRLTYAALDARARAIAAALSRSVEPGDRALLLDPPGLDFVAAFFGCLYAGVIAVPAYPPRSPRRMHRLLAILADARPAVALASAASRRVRGWLERTPEAAEVAWIATDELDPVPAGWEPPAPDGDAVAFLQYTSGSTSTPKGVMVTQANLVHNQRVIQEACGHSEDSVFVSWLPLYHDLGLIGNLLQATWVGAPCVLMAPVAFLQSPSRWLRAVARYRGTTSGGPNFAYDLCVRKIPAAEREELDLSSWRVAFNGAEPVRAGTLERFAEAFAPAGFRRAAFYPCYGLAEATLMVSGNRPGEGPAVHGTTVGCGRVLPGFEAEIVDPATAAPCTPGEVGEIWLAGGSVARGYWNRPAESAETFGAFLGDRGPFLRTGDLGFLDGDQLCIAGRLKDLVILRGRNHYPQDLELTAERSHPALRRGGGAAFAVNVFEGAGEERLVLVHEAERHAGRLEEIAAAVRQAIAEEHEALVYDVVLVAPGGVPKTTSGKVRRRACRELYLAGELPVVGRSALPAGAEEEPPTAPGALREVLAATPAAEREGLVMSWLRSAFSRLARVDAAAVEADQPLTRYGLDSLVALELKNAAEAELGADLPFAALLEGLSLRAAARLALAGPQLPEALSSVPNDRPTHPLSWNQRSLWVLHRLAPESAPYHIAGAARVLGPVDPERLRRALQALIDRHAVLRTTYEETPEGPVQRIAERQEAAFQIEDASSLSEAAFRPFDLEQGPVFRASLLTRCAETWLVLSVHHIAADLWSLAILVRELGILYAGGAESLPEPEATYLDFVRWQEEMLAGPRGEQLAEHWQRLAGAPALDLPTDHPRPAVQGFRGVTRSLRLEPEVLAAVETLARERGCTVFVVLLAAFQTLLARSGGQDEFLVGSPTSGRGAARWADVVGYFVDLVALRSDLAGSPTGGELLARARREALDAFAHQDYPFARLAERLPRPLQAALSWEKAPAPELAGLAAFALGEPGARLTVGGLELESAALPSPGAQRDLTLLAAELDGRLVLSLQADADLFDAVTVERLLGHCAGLLRGLAAAPERRVADLEMLSAPERQALLVEWNATDAEVPRACIHELVEARAEEAPEAPALRGEDGWITYAELASRARGLAQWLVDRDLAPEDVVGVCLERSPEMVISALGVMAAGGAYLPLHPAHPPDRLSTMLADAGARFVLTREGLADRLRGGPAEPVLAGAVAIESSRKPPRRAGPESLAYVIYTSGSTGAPKGSGQTHAGLVNLVTWNREAFGVGPADRAAQVAAPGFDAAVWEVWSCLAAGAALLFPPEPVITSPPDLWSWVAAHGVTLCFLPTPLMDLALGEGVPSGLPLRWLFVGGDRLQRRPPAGRRLGNLYGPTEATVITVASVVSPEGSRPPSIGRPVANTRSYILDTELRPVPAGVTGELFLAGAGLGRGYLGRPGLTAAAFLPDPFGGPGERLYRTGDLARWLPDGRVECLGRADHQVKIRGFRVEPGEVEAVLAAFPGVREAAVVVHQGVAADRRLVAWVVAAPENAGTDAAGLRAALADRLPAHMIPSAIGFLPALPRNASGKVDRRDLAGRTPPADGSEEYQAPRTPAEELIAAIWEDLLGAERIGLSDHFFDRGGHSLLASRAMARLRAPFGVELPLRTLFENPTLGAFAGAVDRAYREGLENAPPPLRPVPRDGAEGGTVLSFAQERLWFLDRLAPGQAVYNVPVAMRLRGGLDPDALQKALDGVVERHEALRTVFAEGSTGPVQVVLPPAPCVLERIDCEEAAALRKAAEEVRRPFDLAAGPVLRALLLRLAPDDHLLVLTIHHIAVDGWSVGLLLGDLEALYQSGSPALPPLPVQYADYAVWQRGWMTGEVLERRIAWWRATLAGAPETLELPADRPRPAAPSRRGIAVSFALPAPLVRRLRETARREDATLFMALLAGFSALLSRLSHQLDLVIGTVAANRDRAELERLVGFFVNALPLRLRLDGSPGLTDLLGRAREAALGAFTHGDVPFERLVEALAPRRDLARTPLFQASLALQETPARPPRLAGVEAAFVPLHTGTARFDLNLVLEEDGGGLSGGVEANADLFEASTVERLLRHLATLLEAAAADPGLPLEDLPLLAPEERRQILQEWSTAGWESPGPALIHELFAEQATRTPDKVAAVCRDEAVTYRELEERASRLARSLDGGLAGLLAGPDHPLLVGLLGTLKAGAGFVPLDPRSPAERLERMIADCGLTVLLTDRRHLPLAEEAARGLARVICLDGTLDPGTERTGDVGDGTAYVIFTSGSTGIPNGVPITHENLVPLLQWSREAFGFGERTRALQSLSYAFDFGVFEILTTLLFGGTLFLQGHGVRGDVPSYLDEIRRHGIDTLHTTPSLFGAVAALARSIGERLVTLEVLHLGGEALGEELVEEAFAITGERCRLFNGYGPTEAAVNCSLFEVDRTAGPRSGGLAAVPIGRPSAANRLYVLDPGMRPVPAGTHGELAVGGPGLSRGYLGRPDLTADRFRPDPFGAPPGGRLYRTGDLVRWRTDGALDYLGRRDQQVKIRGFRVEPGEVEAALARHPRVRQAAVVAAGEGGDRRLVAYVVAEGEEVAAAELRAFLRASLPDHMVPVSFVALPALPLSTNGKVDRRALPDPGEERRDYVPPRNVVEEMLAAVWTDLLGVGRVGAHDDFFTLGGHSLLAVRLVTQVSDTFGVRLPVAAVFDAPTLGELAARIAEEMFGRAGDEILAEVFAI